MTPWGIVGDTVKDLLGLADQYITDKDKLIEFQFKAMELNFRAQETLLATKTTPKVDAFVKIVMVIPQMMVALKPLARPLMGAAMTGFGMFAHYKGIDMDGALHAVFDGAFPAWGASRHLEKARKADKEADYSGYDEDS